MTAYCKKCDHAAFKTWSALRKHQWAAHRESYSKSSVGKKWSPEQKAKFKATLAAKRLAKSTTEVSVIQQQPEMTARQLLAKLTSQRDFMVDVVQLVANLIGE